MKEGYLDAGLEWKTDMVEQCIKGVETHKNNDAVRSLARAMRSLNLEVSKKFPLYREGYENQSHKFVEIGERAKAVAAEVPEIILRTDPGVDRSAHALIERSAKEIADSVREICAASHSSSLENSP